MGLFRMIRCNASVPVRENVADSWLNRDGIRVVGCGMELGHADVEIARMGDTPADQWKISHQREGRVFVTYEDDLEERRKFPGVWVYRNDWRGIK